MTRLSSNGLVRAGEAFCLVLVLAVIVPAWHTLAGPLDKPVVKVNGTILTEANLQETLNEIIPAGPFHGGFSPEKRLMYRQKAFEKMIEKELLHQEAIKRGLRVEEEVKKARARTIKRLGGRKKLKAALKRTHLTDKQYKEKLRKKYLVKRLIALEVREKAPVSDEEVKAYYKGNKERFMRPEARRLTHILISVKPNATAEERRRKRERAQEVIEKIKGGEDMSVVAWNYSDDPYRVKGGDFGLVHKGRLNPSLEKEVRKLKPGQLSGIIETIYGYHVVRVEEVKKPQQLSLDDVSQKIKRELTRKREKRLLEALIGRLRKEARIVPY